MVKQAVARSTDLGEGADPIDRLEEKVKLLVDMITQLRAEQTRSAEDKARLGQEVDSLRLRLADAEEAASTELGALREERDLIRARVTEMLEQLESI